MQGRVYEVWKRARELWVDSQGRREEEETLREFPDGRQVRVAY